MIPLYSPYIPPETGDEVKKVIDSGNINRGKVAEAFEKGLREYFSFPYVHTVNSCTSALRLALAIAGVKRGELVLTTPWTMIATNTAILEQGGIPDFVDIEYDTLNMDLSKVQEAITPQTRVLMVVHYAGYPIDDWKAMKIAAENNLVLIQDCAQSLGAKVYGKYVGSRGTFNCFSFQSVKTITMGDGGAITTSIRSIYDDVVKRSWFGIDKTKRIKTSLGIFPTDVDVLGYKYNITDIDATMGLVGLRHFNQAITKRALIAKMYNEELEDANRIELMHYKRGLESSYWMYPIHVKDRESFAKYMTKAGIEVSKVYEKCYKYSLFPALEPLPVMEKVEKDIMHIPIHCSLTEDDVNYIIKKIKEWDKL